MCRVGEGMALEVWLEERKGFCKYPSLPCPLPTLTCHSLAPGAEEEREDELEAPGRRRNRLRGHHHRGCWSRESDGKRLHRLLGGTEVSSQETRQLDLQVKRPPFSTLATNEILLNCRTNVSRYCKIVFHHSLASILFLKHSTK